jgi:carboxymethylenebutenolidase
MRTWVVYPERKDKAGVVIVIHEIFGLSDWIRGVADALAAEGFIAIAPDLLSGMGPNGGGTESFPSRDAVVQKVRELSREESRSRIDAARQWGALLPASNGKMATLGFCWGGARSFEFAAEPGFDAAVVFYGTSPDSATLERVFVPVLGNYGGDDARVNATLPQAGSILERRGMKFTANVYDGAGHGFLRAQNDREGANKRATEVAWPRTIAFLRENLQ